VALKAMTDWAAYQYFEEKRKGTLEPGKLADLVILEHDPLQGDPTTISTIKVVETIKEGRPIFRLGVDKIDAASAQAASRVAATPELAEQRIHRH
jgi:adenine deaminase